MRGRRSGFWRSSGPDAVTSGAPPRTFSMIFFTAGHADVAKIRIAAAYSRRGTTDPPGPSWGSEASAVVMAHISVRHAMTSPRAACTPRNPSVPLMANPRASNPVMRSSFTARRVPPWRLYRLKNPDSAKDEEVLPRNQRPIEYQNRIVFVETARQRLIKRTARALFIGRPAQ